MPQHPPPRLVAGRAFAGALVIVSALLFARVTETDIETDLLVSELRFATAGEELVSKTIRVNSLGVSGCTRSAFPRRPAQMTTTWNRTPAIKPPSEFPGSRSKARRTVALAPLILPAGRTWRCALPNLRANTCCRFRVPGGNCAPMSRAPSLLAWPARLQALRIRQPQTHRASNRIGDVDLALTFPSVPQMLLAPQLSVRDSRSPA